MLRRRSIVVALAALIAVLAGSGLAVAFWSTSSSGASATVSTSALGQPTASTSNVSASSVTINVTAAGIGLTPSGYRVARTSPSPVNSVCTFNGSTGSCNDSSPVAGQINNYSVYPVLSSASWEGLTPATTNANVPSADTTAPNLPVITFPVAGHAYAASGWTGSITGTASDNSGGSGIQKTQVAVQQTGSTGSSYWNPSTTSFSSSTAVWMDATGSGTGNVNWSLSFARPVDGTYSVQARSIDNANNTGSPVTAGFSIDTQAPGVPSVNVPAYVNIANQSSVAISGTAEKSSSVTVTVTDSATPTHGTATGTATANASTGAWSMNLDLHGLADGALSYGAFATDSASNASSPGTATDTKDTVAPAAPTSVSLSNGGGTGSAFINGANKASLSYSVVEPASSTLTTTDTVTVTLSDGASPTPHTATGTAAGKGSSGGTVSVTGISAAGLNEGTVTATAIVTDAAGNSSSSATGTNTKDTVAPATPTSVALSNGGGTGSAYINGTNKGSLSYSVVEPASSTLAATDTVTVTLSDGASPTPHTANGSAAGKGSAGGTVSITGLSATALNDGPISELAVVIDAAGNVSGSASSTNTKDAVAPGAPSGVQYQDGNSSSGDRVKGSAETGAAIMITETTPHSNTYNDVATGGSFNTAVENLSSGSVTYSVTATDAAGNVSSATSVTATDTK